MDKKEIKQMVKELYEETYNKWNCKTYQGYTLFTHFYYYDNGHYDNGIMVNTSLIGLWRELSISFYVQEQLKKHMIEYIKWFFKNKYEKEIDFKIKFEFPLYEKD